MASSYPSGSPRFFHLLFRQTHDSSQAHKQPRHRGMFRQRDSVPLSPLGENRMCWGKPLTTQVRPVNPSWSHLATPPRWILPGVKARLIPNEMLGAEARPSSQPPGPGTPLPQPPFRACPWGLSQAHHRKSVGAEARGVWRQPVSAPGSQGRGTFSLFVIHRPFLRWLHWVFLRTSWFPSWSRNLR